MTNWETLIQEWNDCRSKLIIVGQNPTDLELTSALEKFSTQLGLPVVADILSNQLNVPGGIVHQDSFLMKVSQSHAQSLQPDLVISLGKSVISKNLKLFLRQYRPSCHWHISEYSEFADPFQSLTRNIKILPSDFLAKAMSKMPPKPDQQAYLAHWQQSNSQVDNIQQTFFENDDFSEFGAIRMVLQNLPLGVDLHLGNSMPVRYVNLLASSLGHHEIEVFGNRGTSGIDGCLSTAVGSALCTNRMVVALLGDVSFFYDRNALWHRHKPDNLKIVLINNQGGGIFRLIEGPANQPELEDYFVGSQALNAKNTANDYGLKYHSCTTQQELKSTLPDFFDSQTGSGLLELTTDPEINTNLFNNYKTLIQDHYGA